MSETSFAERLERIEGGRAGVSSAVCDARTGPADPALRTLLRNAIFPLSFVGAFGLGILSGFVSIVIRGHLMPFDPLGEMGDYYFIVNYLIGLAVSFVLGHMCGINTKLLAPAQTLGIFLTLATGHNLAHWAPQMSAALFSDNWVELQLLRTEPDTLKVRGLVFKFGGESHDLLQATDGPARSRPHIPGAQVVTGQRAGEPRAISGARFVRPEPATATETLCARLSLGC